jgi:hypothetical protein
MPERLAPWRWLTVRPAASPATPAVCASDTLNKYCVTCHNARLETAGLQLDSLDVNHVVNNAQQWEKIIRTLCLGPFAGAFEA